MSLFETLLLNEKDLNLSPADRCDQLFTAPNPLNWLDVLNECQAYRAFLETQSGDHNTKIKAYVLSFDDIKIFMEQTSPILHGIRIYLGLHEIVGTSEKVIRVFGVGCKKNGKGGYDDVNIPLRRDAETSTAPLVEGRPCPRECGDNNDLNFP